MNISMTSNEDAKAETPPKNDDAPSSAPLEDKTKKPTLQRSFRSQYYKLHRSQNINSTSNVVHNLRSRFEQPIEQGSNKVEDKTPGQPTKQNEEIIIVENSVTEEDITAVDQSVNVEKYTEKDSVSENKTVVEGLETPKERKVLTKSYSADDTYSEVLKRKEKRVSFSLENTEVKEKPIPKPRSSASITIHQVTIEEKVIEPEVSTVDTVILSDTFSPDLNSNHLEDLHLAEPEERHIVSSGTPKSSTENIHDFLNSFEMDTKKKRNNSFRSKFRSIFTKEKKPKENDENKKTKKTENAVFADNVQNESFNRHSSQRHTVDAAPRRDLKPIPNHQVHQNVQMPLHQQQELDSRYAAMHINNFQQARHRFASHQQQQHSMRELPPQVNCNPGEDYVCMDKNEPKNNYMNVPKYDSSSTNTIESENSTTSVNHLQQIQQERLAIRSKFFNETPPRAQETHPNLQLVNPKAAIPINSERPLPNPYQQQKQEDEFGDGVYGTVFDRNSVARPISGGESSDVSSLSSPRSPSVERTKLKLPPNRERIDLQPRLRSPIPPSEVSTDKLIATELLKNSKKGDKKDQRTSPSHQKLELEIDYPEEQLSLGKVHQNTFDDSQMSGKSFKSDSDRDEINRETLKPIEAGDWHRVQRELVHAPSLQNVQITTNVQVHVDSPQRGSTPNQNQVPSRSVTPVMNIRSSTSSLQRSPPKHEIRQNVEAFCWKELKKLKEKEEQQMQVLISSCGYAEDPIRRSRSMAPTPRDAKRSTSLPRDVRQRRTEDFELQSRRIAQQQRFNRSSPQRSTIGGAGTRPIFNRGSLTQQSLVDQPIYSKKVSFHSPQNPVNPISWPTKNGFTQSPPQRRFDGAQQKRESLEDEVFLPNGQPEATTPSRDEIFLLNQQRQKEMLLAKAQRGVAPVQIESTNLRNSPISEHTVVDGSVAGSVAPSVVGSVSDIPQMRNIREPIYGTRPSTTNYSQSQIKDMNESPYGSRSRISEIYGTRNGNVSVRSSESPYSSQNNSVNESPRMTNDSLYGTRVINENPYGVRASSESPYGSRPLPNQPNRIMVENIYGTRQMYTIQEPIHGTKQSAMMNHEAIYGSRPSVTMMNQTYGIRQMPNVPRSESPYGVRPPANSGVRYQEPIYGARQHSNVDPVYGTRPMPMSNGQVPGRSDPIYGSRPMVPYYGYPPGHSGLPPGHPGLRNGHSSLQRSNSLRQSEGHEPLYRARPNFNKPPSGAQQRPTRPSTIELSPTGTGPQGRYDYPPDSPTKHAQQQTLEPIYGRRTMTVNNKVCDMYGKIHDTSNGSIGNSPTSPMSPPPAQKAGVLYGQLQRNANVSPMQYQSYQQIQPNQQFIRGTRLTASVNDMHRYNSNVSVIPRNEPPNRPLPPIPVGVKKSRFGFRKKADSGSASKEEEWNDGKRGGLSGSESGGRSDTDGDLRSRSRNNRRDDPRRHTLAGEQYGVMSNQGGPLSRTMDLEGQPRGYPPPSNAMLFDDDPGIMSEVETSSTGFRRGGKQRSSLPVVRTPSKTLERPLGLVFLQYRNETKRALLPNEITSIDTVKALFVRSFPKQLTMEYLDSPQVKIYIHDSSKDMFYELEDLRSHLREIRDRSVLRLFESADVTGGLPMAGIGIAGGAGVPHFEDPSYFSEPEFDSEYQHQHIHKSKGSAKGAPYYIGSTASLPRAGLLRAYSPAVGNLPQDRMKTLPTGAPPKPQRAYSSGASRSGADGAGARAPDRFAQFAQRSNNSLYNIPDGYMSSPERGSRYEEAYYSQYGTRSGSITPVIDEEVSDTELIDDQYSLYGVKMPPQGGPRPAPRTQFSTPAAPPYDATRIRVENMERQLANLTGLVQKALTQPATLQVPSTGRDSYRGNECDLNMNLSSSAVAQTMSDKSVSFEKSVSFSDEPPDMNSPKQHSPQHSADTKPTKPAIKSSTLPRTSSQERDRLKPAPPPKPASLSPGQYDGRHIYRDLQLTPEMYNQLRGLQKKAKDLRAEVRNLRRMSQAQAHSVRETIRDTFIKIRAMLMVGGEQVWQAGMDQERVRLSREEDLYKQEMIRLETDLGDLESTVEELRGNVINRKTRVNMSDVENMALVLSKSSKTVADLKLRFPMLQDGLKSMLGTEMEKVVREETFLKEEPERLESALRRCKKLTGTLVTLKRLASVQEQRLPCSATSADGRESPTESAPITPTSAQHSKSVAGARVGPLGIGGDAANSADGYQRPENALDALLDELQTFSKPHTVNTQIPQVSYPPDSDPPSLPVKGIQPSHNHPPSMHEIGRKGSMDSATFLPTQTLTVSTATGSLRRLHSYPSGSDTDNSPPIQPLRAQDNKQSGKPPLPERNADLLQHISTKRVPPPPPPRTSSKSPLASPTSPSLPPRSPASNLQHIQNVQNMVDNKPMTQFETATQNLGLGTLRRNIQNRSSLKDSNKSQTLPRNIGSNLQIHASAASEGENAISASNSSSCESVNSQDGTKNKRKEELEHRHQELLKKQKALQEQYARLQQLQRGTNTLAVIPPAPDQLLKKTGSESNILQKMGLQLTTSQMTGSLTNLPIKSANQQNNNTTGDDTSTSSNTSSNTTNKVYETDIL